MSPLMAWGELRGSTQGCAVVARNLPGPMAEQANPDSAMS